MTKNIKKYIYLILIVAIFIFGFFARFHILLSHLSFWHDESALAWNIIHKSYGDLFGVLKFAQMSPPFFLVLSKLFVKIFGISDINLRMIPFLFGTLSFILFYFLANRIFENKISTALSLVVFAINQKICVYTAEFKHYICDMFFTILCLYLFFDLISHKASVKKNIIYSLIFALSIWFSITSTFIICAGLAVLTWKQYKEKQFNIKHFSVFAIPLLLSSVLFFKIYIFKNIAGCYLTVYEYWKIYFISKNLSNVGSLFISDLHYLFYPMSYVILTGAFITLGIFVLSRKKPYLSSVMLLSVFFAGIASWLQIYPFGERAILFLMPILIIYICSVFESVILKNTLILAFVMYLLFIATIPDYSYLDYFLHAKNQGFGYHPKEMMQEMQKRIKPSDIILIDHNSDADFAYYSYYYPMKNKIFQEIESYQPYSLLNQIKKHNHYWIFMSYEPAENVEQWIKNHKEDVLFELKFPYKAASLRYIYVK